MLSRPRLRLFDVAPTVAVGQARGAHGGASERVDL